MKYLFASDIHGSVADMRRLVDIIKEEKPDKAIFLGDFCGIGDTADMCEAFRNIKCKLSYVRGNCDDSGKLLLYGVRASTTELTESIAGRKIFCCHGYQYDRYLLPDGLKRGDIFVYGHLHVPSIEEKDGIIVVNDGSMARPRGGFEKTYAIIDDDGAYIKDAGCGFVIFRKLFLYD